MYYKVPRTEHYLDLINRCVVLYSTEAESLYKLRRFGFKDMTPAVHLVKELMIREQTKVTLESLNRLREMIKEFDSLPPEKSD